MIIRMIGVKRCKMLSQSEEFEGKRILNVDVDIHCRFLKRDWVEQPYVA